jgi:small subunit ribosomal protein S6
MRRYETIIIIDPDASEEERNGLCDRVGELIPQLGGFLVERDIWGQRRLAYEINKKMRGHYTRFDFCGTGAVVDELERLFRIDDRVMKFMTVLLEKDVDIDALKAQLAQAKADAQKAAEKVAQEKPAAETQAPATTSASPETVSIEAQTTEGE